MLSFTADLKFPGNFATTDDTHTRHKHQPSLVLLAGSRRGTCLTPPTSRSLGSLSMAAPGVDVLLPATALAVALVALDEVQRDDILLEVEPVDELPREKLIRSKRKNRDVKTCAWAQLLEDKYLDDSTSITAKQFRVDFRLPYGPHCHERANLSLNQCICPTLWFNQSIQNTDRELCHRLLIN